MEWKIRIVYSSLNNLSWANNNCAPFLPSCTSLLSEFTKWILEVNSFCTQDFTDDAFSLVKRISINTFVSTFHIKIYFNIFTKTDKPVKLDFSCSNCQPDFFHCSYLFNTDLSDSVLIDINYVIFTWNSWVAKFSEITHYYLKKLCQIDATHLHTKLGTRYWTIKLTLINHTFMHYARQRLTFLCIGMKLPNSHFSVSVEFKSYSWMMNCFPPHKPFSTNETLQTSICSIPIFIADVGVIPIQTLTASTG